MLPVVDFKQEPAMKLRNRTLLFGLIVMFSAVPLMARDALVGKWKAQVTADDGSKVFDDTITFKGGKFTSEKESADGFQPADYQDQPAPHGLSAQFDVTLTNKDGDTAKWSGFSTGTDITGTLVTTKKDGTSTSYSFKADKQPA
jgi:hypothetical protein